MNENQSLYDVAREVTDDVLGEGTYAKVNEGNHNPGVQAAIKRGEGGPKPWQPMTKGTVNPALKAAHEAAGIPEDDSIEAWGNDLYQVVARNIELDTGEVMTHLSIKRHDRRTIRRWRHLQQIKNEICGPLREAVEIFPSERRLVDGANEQHLWVLPEGVELPFGFPQGLVTNDEDVAEFNAGREAGRHKGRQDEWQPGLTTGRNEHTRYMSDEQREALRRIGS